MKKFIICTIAFLLLSCSTYPVRTYYTPVLIEKTFHEEYDNRAVKFKLQTPKSFGFTIRAKDEKGYYLYSFHVSVPEHIYNTYSVGDTLSGLKIPGHENIILK